MKNIFSILSTSARIKAIPILELVFWLIISASIPFCSGNIPIASLFLISLYYFVSFYLGRIILHNLLIKINFNSLIQVGVELVFGMFVLACSFIILDNNAIVFILLAFYLIFNFKNFNLLLNKKVYKEILVISPFFLFLFLPEEWFLSTNILKGMAWDFGFYTSIVESLNINQDISSAIYQKGIPINYPTFTFFTPAQIANFTSIPSQISLWGIYMHLLSILSFGTLATVIGNMFRYFQDDKETNYFRIVFVVSFLLLFFAPLHMVNIVKGNFEDVLFLGLGYLLPLGSPGYAFSILWMSLILPIILTLTKPTKSQLFLLSVFIVMTAGSKIAIWLPLVLLIGFYTFTQWILDKKTNNLNWLVTILFAGLSSVIIIFSLVLNSKGPVLMYFSIRGQNTKELVDFVSSYGLNNKSFFLLAVFGFCIRLCLYLLPKLTLTFLIIRPKFNFSRYKALYISILLTFIVLTFIYLFFNVKALNLDGTLYRDMTFDNGQYMRSFIFIVHIFIILIILKLFVQIDWKKYSYSYVILIGWLTFCGYSFYHQVLANYYQVPTNTKWYSEVQKDFNTTKPDLMIMLSDGYYSGLGLTAMGISPWYIFGNYNARDGYSNDYETLRRRNLVIEFFNQKNSLAYRKKLRNRLLEAGVNCVVASPFNLEKMKLAESAKLIHKISNTTWFYSLK
jgi:hypothetical protein